MDKPTSLRDKGNRIVELSVVRSEHWKEINNVDLSIVAPLNMKPVIDLQPDEILIPNWTYSTSSGVVYNPIREKSYKSSKRIISKKTKTADSNPHPPVGLFALHPYHSFSSSTEPSATNLSEILSAFAKKSFYSSSIFTVFSL